MIPGPLYTAHLAGNGDLVGLLVGVAAVAVREVDVAVGLRHHAADRVPPLPDNVRVVRVAHVHLHRHAAKHIKNLD
jgi:hypothetical protein